MPLLLPEPPPPAIPTPRSTATTTVNVLSSIEVWEPLPEAVNQVVAVLEQRGIVSTEQQGQRQGCLAWSL